MYFLKKRFLSRGMTNRQLIQTGNYEIDKNHKIVSIYFLLLSAL